MKLKIFINIIIIASTALPTYVSAAQLSLPDTISQALSRAPELVKARLAVEESKLSEPLLLSEMDTAIETNYSKTKDEAPRVAPAFEGTKSEIENFNVALVQKTLLGTDARLVWDNQKIENAAQFRILDPSAESTLTLRIRQPLLRYFWGRPDIARRRRFRTAVAAQEAQLRQTTEHMAQHAARLYLNVVFAKERVRVGELAVTEAKRLLESYSGKKKYGLIEESDLLQAKASLEAVATDLDLAKSDLKRAWSSLHEILRYNDENIPVEINVSFPTINTATSFQSLHEALRIGLNNRGDVTGARLRKESAEWSHRSQKLDTLPDLAFVGSYGGAGLDNTFSKAWDDLGGFDHIVKSAGVNLTIPFGFKKEALLRKSTKIQLGNAEQNLLETEDRVQREIEDAWTNAELQKTRLEARERLLKLQTQKLNAEVVEFQRGRSSTDILVRFQQDMFQAELEYSRSKIDALMSQIELAYATGTLTEFLNLGQKP